MKKNRRDARELLTIVLVIWIAIGVIWTIFNYLKFVFSFPWWLAALLFGVFGLMVWSYQMEKSKRDRED